MSEGLAHMKEAGEQRWLGADKTWYGNPLPAA